MDYIVIAGVKPYDGRYELDLEGSGFTTREWGFIKRLSGYLPLTITDGLKGGDAELFSVFAVIALRRAGKIEQADVQGVFDRIADADFGSAVTLETDQTDQEEEADAGPPPASSTGNGSSSGTGGRTSSGISTSTLPATGDPDSGFSEFDLIRSGS
jgi:hypothetical protein